MSCDHVTFPAASFRFEVLIGSLRCWTPQWLLQLLKVNTSVITLKRYDRSVKTVRQSARCNHVCISTTVLTYTRVLKILTAWKISRLQYLSRRFSVRSRYNMYTIVLYKLKFTLKWCWCYQSFFPCCCFVFSKDCSCRCFSDLKAILLAFFSIRLTCDKKNKR